MKNSQKFPAMIAIAFVAALSLSVGDVWSQGQGKGNGRGNGNGNGNGHAYGHNKPKHEPKGVQPRGPQASPRGHQSPPRGNQQVQHHPNRGRNEGHVQSHKPAPGRNTTVVHHYPAHQPHRDVRHVYHYHTYRTASGPPPWAPAHGFRAKHRYVYFAGYDMYFDRHRSVYIYLTNRGWQISASFPIFLAQTRGYHMAWVEIDYLDDDPYRYYDNHRVVYTRY
jgi:hypothetical protein